MDGCGTVDQVVQGHVWERAYACYDRSRGECDAVSVHFVDGMQCSHLGCDQVPCSGNAIAFNSVCVTWTLEAISAGKAVCSRHSQTRSAFFDDHDLAWCYNRREEREEMFRDPFFWGVIRIIMGLWLFRYDIIVPSLVTDMLSWPCLTSVK